MTKAQIIVNGKVANLEIGHTYNEWENTYGSNEDCWDFSVDDILTGAIEPNEEIIYWYIGGRIYETE